jgi:DNA-binding transcriptional LysR family regulator
MDRWTELELFVRAAELGSLSRAAENLNVSNAAASRHLAALESRLSARLIERNTRRLFLTEVGEEFYERCTRLLAELHEAESAANAQSTQPTGTLRVTASLSFCVKHIAPLLPAYLQRYPLVSVQTVAANRYYDVIDNGIDVAVRTREYEPDSSLTVRRLAQTRRILAAAPGYLERCGTPKTLDELAQHKLLIYSYSNHPQELRFTHRGETCSVRVKPMLEANDGQVLRAAALEGLGILVQPKYILYDDIVAGRLVPVLDDHELPPLTINIAYPSRKHLSAKVRTFADFLLEQFRAMDYEGKWMS